MARFLRLCAICLIVTLVLCSSVPAFAAAKVNWKNADFFFDGTGKPVLIGFFVNEGTETVTVTGVRHQIYLQKGGSDWFFAAAGAWTGFNVTIKPGERSGLYRLRVADYAGMVYEFDRYRTKGDIRYSIFSGDDV